MSDRFLAAIEVELSSIQKAGHLPPVLDTVFIGGGTPTHLDPVQLERLCSSVRNLFRLAEDVEWTLEANPEDITREKLDVLRTQGVNRISLGVQSFDQKKLRALERDHDGMSVRRTIEQVACVISNVSIDLIFSSPGETLRNWRNDLAIATSLPISHVSTYALTIEKGTSFWSRRRHGKLSPVSEETEVQMYDASREHFAGAGLSHYEISNFARSGSECRHNLNYWRGDDWLAVGPGAAAYVQGRRTVNHRSTTTYLKRMESGQSPIAESESVSSVQAAREAAAFGVRLIAGVDLSHIGRRHGVDIWKLCANEIHGLVDGGLVTVEGSIIKLTDHGIHFADTVAAEFLG